MLEQATGQVGGVQPDRAAGQDRPAGAARLVVVRRRHAWVDRLRSYRVRVDGVGRGEVRNGRELELFVEPGRRRVDVRIDWSGSPPLALDLAAGESVTLDVEWRGDLFSRDGWLRLRRRPA
ncbi:MAG: hypothetical protein M3P95_09975 [Actinomycetota bacterium]|nr:hypothetical protein [Actinomycetota bacterium]